MTAELELKSSAVKKSEPHHRYSPSKLESLALCPCYTRVPDEPVDTAAGEETPAETGTRLHAVLETGNLDLCRDQEERTRCENTLMIIDGKMKSKAEVPEVYKEIKLTLGDLTYGTADIVLVWKGAREALVLDYKFIRSANVSEPSENIQLMCYAGGAFYQFPQVDKVSVGLLAPNIDWCPEPFIYSRSDLDNIEARIRKIVDDANDPFKKPTPCDICSQCKHAAKCPALCCEALTVAKAIGLPVPSSFAPEAIVSDLDRAKAQVVARALATWSEQIIKNNNACARAGTELPGHSIVHRAGSLRIKDTAVALEVLRTIMCMDDILKCITLKLPALAEQMSLVNGQKEAECKAFIEEKLGSAAERGAEVVFYMRKKSVSDTQLLLGQ